MRRVLPAVLSSLLAAGLLFAGQPALAQPTDPPASTYTSVSPVRVLDTRNGTGTGSTNPVGPGSTIVLDLASRVPATATAVVLNVTGVSPTANTFVTVFPSGIARPATSNLNLTPSDIRPIQVTVALGTNRTVSLYNNAGNTHLVADLAGYYATSAGAKFTALPPNRVLDTRQTGNPPGTGGTVVLNLADRIPASATAVTFNLTATSPTNATYVTAFPTGTPVPTASNLNLTAGDTRANLVTVTVGANRQVTLYNNVGSTQLIADLTGFYTADYGAAFYPLTPSRVLDTRNGTGTEGLTLPFGEAEVRAVDLTASDLPATATGVVLNVTGVGATGNTFVTAWPVYENQPLASTLNLSTGQTVPNAAVVSLGRAPGFNLYNNVGEVHLVADLAGVFAVNEAACTTNCVYAWGDNFSRKLGTGEVEFDQAVPELAVGVSDVQAVDGGPRNGYALRTNGTIVAWGNNDAGQLGNGWTSNNPATGGTGGGSAVPVPVANLTGITAIAGGGATVFALRNDGAVWAWGAGTLGLLGNGGTANSSLPTRVGTLTNVVSIANTGSTGYAARSDGTVWSWGDNTAGALGNNSTVTHSTVPVQVSGLTNVTRVAGNGSNGYAVRGDGTVWAWGNNAEGQLGNGSTAAFSRVPVQVSGLTNVTAIAAGRYNGYAVRSDGTVWAWGAGSNGALGSSTINCTDVDFPCARRTPVQVSNLTDATTVASFEYGAYALRENGTVAAWGYSGSHALGTDTGGADALTPVTVTDLSDVTAIGAGEYAGFAVVPTP